ncbi:MAG: hypothetical protein ABJE47_19825 [bacterium]
MKPLRVLGTLVLAAVALFFARYEVRLLSVWSSMPQPRATGAYIGLVAFPLIALACGWAAWRLIGRRSGPR